VPTAGQGIRARETARRGVAIEWFGVDCRETVVHGSDTSPG
jgi:hypothetical protein